MSLEREFIDSYGEFINDELINVWENGYCGYWIPNKDDIVLIGLWDFQDDKCSIIHKYAEDEVSKLIHKKETPSNFKISLEDDFNEENDNYFDYSQISSSESDDEDED